MASRDLHLKQAEHNRDLALELGRQDPMLYKDWAVVCGFYSAVHYVEALLTGKAEGHSDGQAHPHEFRKDCVDSYYSNPCIRAYRKLYRLSLILRYLVERDQDGGLRDAEAAAGGWISDNDVRSSCLHGLDRIREDTAKHLGITLQ